MSFSRCDRHPPPPWLTRPDREGRSGAGAGVSRETSCGRSGCARSLAVRCWSILSPMKPGLLAMWMCKSSRRSARSIVCAGCQGSSSRECTGDRTFGPWQWTTATATPVPQPHPHPPLGALAEGEDAGGDASDRALAAADCRDHVCTDPPRAVGARGARCAVRRGVGPTAGQGPSATPAMPGVRLAPRRDRRRCQPSRGMTTAGAASASRP